jgi:hypothetical protein
MARLSYAYRRMARVVSLLTLKTVSSPPRTKTARARKERTRAPPQVSASSGASIDKDDNIAIHESPHLSPIDRKFTSAGFLSTPDQSPQQMAQSTGLSQWVVISRCKTLIELRESIESLTRTSHVGYNVKGFDPSTRQPIYHSRSYEELILPRLRNLCGYIYFDVMCCPCETVRSLEAAYLRGYYDCSCSTFLQPIPTNDPAAHVTVNTVYPDVCTKSQMPLFARTPAAFCNPQIKPCKHCRRKAKTVEERLDLSPAAKKALARFNSNPVSIISDAFGPAPTQTGRITVLGDP